MWRMYVSFLVLDIVHEAFDPHGSVITLIAIHAGRPLLSRDFTCVTHASHSQHSHTSLPHTSSTHLHPRLPFFSMVGRPRRSMLSACQCTDGVCGGKC